jgi:hypothetical protein
MPGLTGRAELDYRTTASCAKRTQSAGRLGQSASASVISMPPVRRAIAL